MWAVKFEGVEKRYRRGGDRFPSLRQELTHARHNLGARLRRRPVQRRGTLALEDVSFEIPEGEAWALIGGNGAGKSTALRLIMRISPPTAGRIRLNGSVGGMIELGTGIHPELSGRENIWLYGTILGIPRPEIGRRFDEIVDFGGLDGAVDRQVKYYSSGMQLRLGFSIASFLRPEIFVVDEALAVGDAAFQAKCIQRMGDMVTEGRTLLYVSHSLTSVQELCAGAVLLDGGRVLDIGPAAEVIQTYVDRVTSAIRQTHNEGDAVDVKDVRVVSVPSGRHLLRTDAPIRIEVDFLSSDRLGDAVFSLGVTDGRGGQPLHDVDAERSPPGGGGRRPPHPALPSAVPAAAARDLRALDERALRPACQPLHGAAHHRNASRLRGPSGIDDLGAGPERRLRAHPRAVRSLRRSDLTRAVRGPGRYADAGVELDQTVDTRIQGEVVLGGLPAARRRVRVVDEAEKLLRGAVEPGLRDVVHDHRTAVLGGEAVHVAEARVDHDGPSARQELGDLGGHGGDDGPRFVAPAHREAGMAGPHLCGHLVEASPAPIEPPTARTASSHGPASGRASRRLVGRRAAHRAAQAEHGRHVVERVEAPAEQEADGRPRSAEATERSGRRSTQVVMTAARSEISGPWRRPNSLDRRFGERDDPVGTLRRPSLDPAKGSLGRRPPANRAQGDALVDPERPNVPDPGLGRARRALAAARSLRAWTRALPRSHGTARAMRATAPAVPPPLKAWGCQSTPAAASRVRQRLAGCVVLEAVQGDVDAPVGQAEHVGQDLGGAHSGADAVEGQVGERREGDRSAVHHFVPGGDGAIRLLHHHVPPALAHRRVGP